MLLILLFLWGSLITSSSLNISLELVHVVFRHGSRTPAYGEICAGNMHMDLWKKIGFSQLTTVGKQESYKLGATLRNRYKNFLSDKFEPGLVETQCVDTNRTKMTALLVLAGLFSTSIESLTNKTDLRNLYYSHPLQQDYELRHVKHYCPAYHKEMQQILSTTEYQTTMSKYQDTIDILSKHCAVYHHSLLDALFVYQSVSAQKYMNLSISNWEDKICDSLYQMSALQLNFENYNLKLKRITGGRLFKKILKNMKKKVLNQLIPTERKVFLYSAHDATVVGILAVLGWFKVHHPTYNSAVIIELHRELFNNKYFVKVFYQKNVYSQPEELFIEECGEFCELSELDNIMEPYLPANYTKECESNVYLH